MAMLRLGTDGKPFLQLASGRRRQLSALEGHRTVVVLDCSASMAGQKLADAATGVMDYAFSAFKGGYEIGLVRFESACSWACAVTTDRRRFADAVDRLRASGGTRLAPAIVLAASVLPATTAYRVMVIATDGHTMEREAAIQAAQRASAAGVTIITLGTPDADADLLSRIATTSAHSVFVQNHELARGFRRASALLPALR